LPVAVRLVHPELGRDQLGNVADDGGQYRGGQHQRALGPFDGLAVIMMLWVWYFATLQGVLR
jgi:hypothetical protein